MKKIFKILLVLVLAFTLIGCDGFNFNFGNPFDTTENGDSASPTYTINVESTNNKHKIEVDEELQLSATIYPTELTGVITFSSNNVAIATVNNSGRVTGVSSGIVKITAKSSVKINNKTEIITGHIYITVVEKEVPITGVTIDGPGNTYIDDLVKYTLNLTPENANQVGTWSVDNELVAKIDQNGRLVAISIGAINVKYSVDGVVKATKAVYVLGRNTNPTAIEIEVRDEVAVGESLKAYIKTTPIGALNDVTWKSSNQDILTIDSYGTINTLKAGVVTITAERGILEATKTIEVTNYKVDSGSLEEQQVAVFETTKHAVFGVSNHQIDENQILRRVATGTGFIYKVEFFLKDGSILDNVNNLRSFDEVDYFKYYLITNHHVIEDSDALKVYITDIELELDATLIQHDDKVDLAIITFEYNKYIRQLVLGNSSELVQGLFAYAIGNPHGYEYSFTAGIISHPKRYLATDTDGDGVNDWDSEYIQHDVAINPGNSGGPLFNIKGEVIGINTLKLVDSKTESMGFSIPIDVAKAIIPILEEGEKPVRALIGIRVLAVKDILKDPYSEYTIPEGIEFGLYVDEVVANSVASRGGVLADDIIIKFNNVNLTNSQILRAELNNIVVGSNTEIEIIVYRNGEYKILTLVF